MLAIERRNEILEKLQMEKRVVVSELSQIYKVSEETIRRDLEKLEKDGLVIKSYGGAVLKEHSIFDLPHDIRKKKQIVEKQKIAGLITELVREGETLMLDASSTSVYAARALREARKKTDRDHQLRGDPGGALQHTEVDRDLHRGRFPGEVFRSFRPAHGPGGVLLSCGYGGHLL